MTHEQTFPGPSGKSVNLRVKPELLPPCMYSFALLRILHYIISIRQRHPKTEIFISKFDLDAAYRRCHLSGQTAHECLSIHNNTLFMALRMTFGGSPCPSLWGYMSETMVDVCNAIIHNKHWNPNELSDPISHTLPHPTSLPDIIPFHQAKELAVQLTVDDEGKADIYLDDKLASLPISTITSKECVTPYH
jgi:hypothetical protein